MLNWIYRALGAVTGAVDETIRRWVGDLITGVYGLVHTVFGMVGRAWIDMLHAAEWMYVGTVKLAIETYATLWHILRTVIPGVVRWADFWIHYIERWVIEIWHSIAVEFNAVRHWTAALVDAARTWVVRDIWSPIWRTLTPVFSWVTHEGATLWHYLTHPADLINLLWDHMLAKMEHEAWTAGRLLGRFFLALVIHNVKTFAILIEDIITAIL